MDEVLIYTNKNFVKFILFLPFFAVLFSGLFFLKNHIVLLELIKGVVIFLAITWGILLIFYMLLLYGRKLFISELGINMGRRYLGPLRANLEKYELAIRLSKQDLFIPWGEIKKVYTANWSRWWARHWNIATPVLSGENLTASDVAAQVLGVPAKRWGALLNYRNK